MLESGGSRIGKLERGEDERLYAREWGIRL